MSSPLSFGKRSSDIPVDKASLCAPWMVNGKNITVVIRTGANGRFKSWKKYQSGKGYLGGEAYWMASLHYALKDMGFAVKFSSHTKFGSRMDIKRLKRGSYHRVVVDGNFLRDAKWPRTLVRKHPELMCKVRHAEWWSGHKSRNVTKYELKLRRYHPPYHPKRVLSPYLYPENEEDEFAPIPFFVHSEVTLPPINHIEPPIGSSPQAFLLDKKCRFSPNVIQGLIEEGFTLHVTCLSKAAKSNLKSVVPQAYLNSKHLIDHSRMKPQQFAKLLRHNISMVIGFGEPKLSPTPYEALANGAAFIHPITVSTRSEDVFDTILDDEEKNKDFQHRMLMHLGVPYVYNYERFADDGNLTTANILKVARMAGLPHNRFKSYIPEEHQLDYVKARLCTNLIEEDLPCMSLS